MRLGIVGLPNAGKSTLFNALTRAGAVTAPYPFTTVEPNLGVVAVPDPRLEDLGRILGPEQLIPVQVEFLDIAGLVRGASKGEGLGNQFLGHIREVDGLVHVLRCFESDQVSHTEGNVHPGRDYQIVRLEMALADLETLARRRAKVQKALKSGEARAKLELDLLDRLEGVLSRAGTFDLSDLTPVQKEILEDLHLLTARPELVVANAGDRELPLPPAAELLGDLGAFLEEAGIPVVVVAAGLEADLAEMPSDDATELSSELGLGESGLVRLVRGCYQLLDLITFFTTNQKEVRARTLARGKTAYEAAGKVHTDMQKGFIRAEVIGAGELIRAGSFAAARDQGLIRLEGRDYVVRDGDILYFRFSS